jgi:pyrrolidone-carboxylate peptidase
MYYLCGRTARAGIPAGFIHLPPTPDLIRSNDRAARTGEPLESQIAAIRAVMRVVAESLG